MTSPGGGSTSMSSGPARPAPLRDIAACTIASHNYMAMATVFASSYREHHPDAEIYVCIVDRRDPEIDYDSLPFRCIFAEDLGIPAFSSFSFRYDILELNTAVKPFLLSVLRDRFAHDRAFYFDPDIWILDRLEGLMARLDKHPVVLTPHVTAPLDDDHDPAERKILQVGIYNLGFLGLRLDDATQAFLDWWQDRLHRFCLADPPHGLFVDQQWASFAPALVDGVFVERDPIYNVAYWNLPHRHPRHVDGAWRVDGRKVAFFHFSGVRFDDLRTVSKHQDRLAPGSRPELRPLFEEYRDQVCDAGHRRWQRHPYTYGHFLGSSGAQVAPIPDVARRTLQRVDPRARRWVDPFDASHPDSFFRWLEEPLPVPAGRVNRAVLALWEERDDLLLTFPDLQDLDLHGFLDWVDEETSGGRPPLPRVFLRGLRSRVPRRVARHLNVRGDSAAGRVYRAQLDEEVVLATLRTYRAGNLISWLNDPVPGRRHERPLITRLMMLLFEIREDLRRDYPDPLGDDQQSFAYWFCREGAVEFDVAEEFVTPVRRSLRWRSRLGLLRHRWSGEGAEPPIAAPPMTPDSGPEEAPSEKARSESERLRPGGVQLVGFFAEDASREESSREQGEALASCDRDVVRLALDQNVWGKSSGGRIHPPNGAPYDLTVLHVPPYRTAEALSTLPISVRAGRVVGWWSWDLAHLHLGGVSGLGELDEIWAPSTFVQNAVTPLADGPVRLVPPYVPIPSGGAAERALHGEEAAHDDRVIFFSSFDAGDVIERARPLALVELWSSLLRETQMTGRTPLLSIRIDRAGRKTELVDELRRRARALGESAVVIHDDPTVPESALLASCDVWISLDRGSGFGLRALRAIRLGKPVIATGYGGVMDFLDEDTGYPVDYELSRLTRHEGVFPAGAVWAETDLRHALERVCQVCGDPKAAARRAEAAVVRVRAVYGREPVSERIATVLSRLQGEPRDGRR
ncbi:MAG: hypothetical protein MPN21_14995 [Thermoanaerobaculia bacterium]|nr:hypothetical protein [Thermoanaerobaculia bacterium]